MTDTKGTESTFEIRPGDVSVNELGGVEIINPQLADAVKTAMTKAGALAAANKNTGCGNNLYQCKPAKAAE